MTYWQQPNLLAVEDFWVLHRLAVCPLFLVDALWLWLYVFC